MKAAFAPYILRFIHPATTSRCTMTEKKIYFLKIWEEENPEIFGIGECAFFKGLSKEKEEGYEDKLKELCRNIANNEQTDIADYSSIRFGLEGAIYDYSNGGKRIYFPSKFNDGEAPISINGLVWMGSKEYMKAQIDTKIANGFKTIKLKIGGIDFNSELELLEYIRCQYSPNLLEIRLDANGAFTPINAMHKLEKLSAFDIHSIEQPIKAGQWKEMGDLVKNSPIPIALDEDLIGITDYMTMNELLRAIAPNYIILKPSLMGGIEGSLEWLKMASQYNIGGWITSALESNIGLSQIAQWVATLDVKIPQGLGTGSLYENNIPSQLVQEKDYLTCNPNIKWVLPELNWME